jgi:iron uptake system EfeUOB component EfeO/EfeM
VRPAKAYRDYVAAGLTTLLSLVTTLNGDVARGDLAAARRNWLPAHLDLGLRTHEILENALQFQLSGHDDYGSGTTLANVDGTRELLSLLRPALTGRYGPGLLKLRRAAK